MRSAPPSILPEGLRTADAIVLGAAIPSGWVLRDVLVFVKGGAVGADLAELLPGSLAGVALGALVAWALTRWRHAAAVLLLATAAVSLLPKLVDVPFARSVIWLPRAGFLMLAALVVTAHLQSRWKLGALRLGLCAGFVACLIKTAFRLGALTPTFWNLLVLALLLGLLGALRRPLVRRLATAAVLLLTLPGPVRVALRSARVPRADLPPPTAAAPSGAPNLVLIVLDTVRADRLAPYGHERVTTPRLDAFVREHATRYTDARSTSPWTVPSHGSLFTGLLPAEHGATSIRGDTDSAAARRLRLGQPLRDDVPTLAERLREAGYQTAGIVANCYNLSPLLGMDRGFEHYDHRTGCWVKWYQALAQLAGARPWVGHRIYRGGGAISDAAIEWLESARRDGGPFFLMLNYMDAHEPLIPPSPYDRAFGDARPTDPLSPDLEMWPLLYDRALLYLDAQVARVLDALEEQGLFEDAVVIVTSDHGEALGERGFPGHGWTLYDDVVRVPLYVKPAGRRAVEVVTDPISGTDLPRLVFDELGLDPAELPPVPDAPRIIAEWYRGVWNVPWELAFLENNTGTDLDRDLIAWLDGRRKIIVSSNGVVEAYDLDADPGERTPLELDPEVVEAFRASARAWWEAHPPPEGQAAPEVDAEMEDRMRALGYGG